jgi:hypothetical protein
VYRVLVRHGLVSAIARKRRREDYRRWERPGPMQLWQLDIMGSVMITDPTAPGGVVEAKLISGSMTTRCPRDGLSGVLRPSL